MDSLGARIKKIRGPLSREVFAKKYGIHRNTLERYEKGTRKIPEAFLFQLAECEQLCLKWVQTGEGPMYRKPDGCKESETGNVLPFFSPPKTVQPIENVTSKKKTTGNMLPAALISEENRSLYEKILELQERLLKASEEKAELQVSLERAMVTIERRDMRIHELEKENAGLREAQKGAAALQHDAEWRAG